MPISAASSRLRRELLSRLGPASYIQANTLFLFPASLLPRTTRSCARSRRSTSRISRRPTRSLAGSMRSWLLTGPPISAKIRTPTLVLAAQDDVITPAYFSEDLARRIPGAEAKFFPQGGHDFPHVAPREFNQAVLPFLQAHTPAHRAFSRLLARRGLTENRFNHSSNPRPLLFLARSLRGGTYWHDSIDENLFQRGDGPERKAMRNSSAVLAALASAGDVAYVWDIDERHHRLARLAEDARL